jgi:hemerythrin-like domain-containing protein
MPITIGTRPQADFTHPLGLLSDCHRRIEHFLSVLLRVVDGAHGQALDEAHRRAVQTALLYFDEAAPKHTADEEQSLFPRLRQLAGRDDQVAEAMAKLAALEADHETANEGHAEARGWFERWLGVGTLAPAQVERLRRVLLTLQGLYQRHIQVEDSEVFALAARVLSEHELAAVGSEMASRRGLQRPH